MAAIGPSRPPARGAVDRSPPSDWRYCPAPNCVPPANKTRSKAAGRRKSITVPAAARRWKCDLPVARESRVTSWFARPVRGVAVESGPPVGCHWHLASASSPVACSRNRPRNTVRVDRREAMSYLAAPTAGPTRAGFPAGGRSPLELVLVGQSASYDFNTHWQNASGTRPKRRAQVPGLNVTRPPASLPARPFAGTRPGSRARRGLCLRWRFPARRRRWRRLCARSCGATCRTRRPTRRT